MPAGASACLSSLAPRTVTSKSSADCPRPRALLAQLQSLAPHERRALELRVVDELSYDEVADRLSIRPAAARLRVSRALRRLASTIPREEV